jgi:hypothetical protein
MESFRLNTRSRILVSARILEERLKRVADAFDPGLSSARLCRTGAMRPSRSKRKKTLLTDLHRELQHASTDGYCMSYTEYQPEASARVPLPYRKRIAASLADASGSSRQTATLVTPSVRPVVSAEVLLELARWCQQRLAFTEVGISCGNTHLDSQSPPFCAPGHAAQEAGDPQLATVGPQHAAGAASPSDADDRAPRPKVVRQRRKGGSR